MESLGHAQPQEYPCASELEKRQEAGGGQGEEQEGREKPGGDEETLFPVFEAVDV